MLEQQQAQINKQAAEISDLKKQLAGNKEALATKADKEEVVANDKTVISSLSKVDLSLYPVQRIIFIVPIATFNVVFVLLTPCHDQRKVVHVNKSSNQLSPWIFRCPVPNILF